MSEVTEQKRQILGQFSQQAEGYARLTTGLAANDRQAAFRALIDPRPDDLVLDVCCGPAHIALDLAPYVSRVTGLDLTPAMLDQARAAATAKGIANADWFTGDICDLPFQDGVFTIVACGAAFHHLTDPVAAFAEMVRVCAPGGRIVVRDVTPSATKSAGYDEIEKLRDPSHTHALTPEEMAGLGRGLPVSEPSITRTLAADLPLDSVLATSFPESCSTDDIRALFHADALSGEDRYGFATRLIDGTLRVSYPMTIALWVKQ